MKQVEELRLTSVFANPDQPRKHFDPDKLRELAESIRQYSVQEPIKVIRRGDGFMIVMGERRWRASLLAGKETIPAIIEHFSPEEVEELALIENVIRADLNPLEEARAFANLLKRMDKEELSKKMGFKQTWRIDERLSLLKLTAEIQDMTANGLIGHSEAFEMSRLPVSQQPAVLKKLLAGELGTYNKIRAFVNGLLMVNQNTIFTLQALTSEEQSTIKNFDTMLTGIERTIAHITAQGKAEDLRKAGFHGISSDRLDLIIKALQRIRKEVLTGQGAKAASAA